MLAAVKDILSFRFGKEAGGADGTTLDTDPDRCDPAFLHIFQRRCLLQRRNPIDLFHVDIPFLSVTRTACALIIRAGSEKSIIPQVYTGFHDDLTIDDRRPFC